MMLAVMSGSMAAFSFEHYTPTWEWYCSVCSGDDGERCDRLNATLSNVQAQVLEYPDTQELNAAIELVLKQYTPTWGWC